MLLEYHLDLDFLTVLISPSILIFLSTDIQTIINTITSKKNAEMLIENNGMTSKLKGIGYRTRIGAQILSFIATVSILALVLWTDFGILRWTDESFTLQYLALGLVSFKLAIGLAPLFTRCLYDSIFEHLYVEYLHLKNPVTFYQSPILL